MRGFWQLSYCKLEQHLKACDNYYSHQIVTTLASFSDFEISFVCDLLPAPEPEVGVPCQAPSRLAVKERIEQEEPRPFPLFTCPLKRMVLL
jgi:hypothetical protein